MHHANNYGMLKLNSLIWRTRLHRQPTHF